MRWILGSLLTLLSWHVTNAAELLVPARIEISEEGGFWVKTSKELDTKEARAIITALGTLLGGDGGDDEGDPDAGATATAAAQVTRLERVEGEEHFGYIGGPSGYDVCKAAVDWGNVSITGEVTFDARVARNPPTENGLQWYGVVPKNRSTGQWLKASMLVQFVPHEETASAGCWPTNTWAWKCKGPDCPASHFYPGARK